MQNVRLIESSHKCRARPLVFSPVLVPVLIASIGLLAGCGHNNKPANIAVGTYFEREPEPYEEISADDKFLVVEIDVENVSEKPFYTSLGATVNQQGNEYVYFMLNDPEGRVYAESLISDKNTQLPESVDPGETVNGFITFDVPRDWSTLTLSAKYRVFPRNDEEEVFFHQELTRLGRSGPP